MKTKPILHVLLLVLLSLPALTRAQGTAFSYQGHLVENAVAANGGHDFIFALFNSAAGGAQIGPEVPLNNTAVASGQFNVTLDFGANVFTGAPRWLEISVRPAGVGPFTKMDARVSLLPTPYASFAATAGSVASGALTANQLNTGGIAPTPGQFLSYSGGNLFWSDPGVAVGNIWSRSGADTYYSAGNVGIGLNSPTVGVRLEVNGTTKVNGGGSGGYVYFHTPSGESGMSIIGDNRADVRFDGTSLKLLAGFGSGAMPSENGITIDTSGNVGVGTNMFFGSQPRQMFNLFGTGFGIGVQTADLYFRSGAGFAWHVGGAHNDATYNSGGGTTVATLDLATGLDFGSRLGQHLSLWGRGGARQFDIGIQASTMYFRTGNGAGDAFAWYKGGAHNDGVRNAGGGQSLMTLDGETGLFVAGAASVCTLTIRGGCDLAEPFPMKEEEAAQKGSVVVIDDEHPGQLKLSTEPYDTRVAGIISGANGVNAGIALHQEGIMDGGPNVALSGRVYVQADASFGAIRPGDLLTTSSTSGHAMKVSDHARSRGAILGKSMSSLKEGKGMVLVLVTLQ